MDIKLLEQLEDAHRENGYRLAVLDFQEMLLEAKKQVWMNPQELYNHLADQITHATNTRELTKFTPEREYNK